MSEQDKSGKQDAIHLALRQNKSWAQSTASEKPDLFPTLASGQSPQILWIGCSDSRIPETTVLGLQPGDVFVHRNIANVLPPTDLSSQAVITYAVAHLKVKHVVVCGHTSCGGVNAALGNGKLGVIDTWLLPLRQLRKREMAKWLKEGLSEKERAVRLVEANVRQGVETVREHAEVVARREEVTVHGLVYDVACGELKEIECEDDEESGKARVDAFGFKPEVQQSEIDDACNQMMALSTQCVHPETQKSYIKGISGGKNNSTERARAPYTYGFVVEFANEEDREFYLKKDPAHLAFVEGVKKIAKGVGSFDYVPGVF